MTKATKSSERVGVAAPANQLAAQAQISDEIHMVLGSAPLIAGEDTDAYQAFFERVRADVRPAGAVEELYCNDVVALAWESLRYRRLKTTLLRSLAPTGLKAALATVLDVNEARRLTKEWLEGLPEAIERVEFLLKSSQPASDVIAAHTLAVNLRLFEPIDGLSMRADARRNAALRELDRSREALAQKLRRALDDVDDAEFQDVPRLKTGAIATEAIK